VRSRRRRAHNHPARRPAVVGKARGVFDELETETFDEEGDRGVVVIDDDRDLCEERH
jgi:hypothetical protein